MSALSRSISSEVRPAILAMLAQQHGGEESNAGARRREPVEDNSVRTEGGLSESIRVGRFTQHLDGLRADLGVLILRQTFEHAAECRVAAAHLSDGPDGMDSG